MYKVTAVKKEFNGIERFVFGIEHVESGQRIEDVSTWRSDVEVLVKRMNDGELDPDQMIDVAEDYICELEEEDYEDLKAEVSNVCNKIGFNLSERDFGCKNVVYDRVGDIVRLNIGVKECFRTAVPIC